MFSIKLARMNKQRVSENWEDWRWKGFNVLSALPTWSPWTVKIGCWITKLWLVGNINSSGGRFASSSPLFQQEQITFVKSSKHCIQERYDEVKWKFTLTHNNSPMGNQHNSLYQLRLFCQTIPKGITSVSHHLKLNKNSKMCD